MYLLMHCCDDGDLFITIHIRPFQCSAHHLGWHRVSPSPYRPSRLTRIVWMSTENNGDNNWWKQWIWSEMITANTTTSMFSDWKGDISWMDQNLLLYSKTACLHRYICPTYLTFCNLENTWNRMTHHRVTKQLSHIFSNFSYFVFADNKNNNNTLLQYYVNGSKIQTTLQ